jgi:triacylglycerol lipase
MPDLTIPTILVPGWMDNEGTLGRMGQHLRKCGQEPFVCSPQPSDGSLPVDRMAQLLGEFIDATIGPNSAINLFGFSMGGLICRAYIQQQEGWKRVRRFVTVATPHRGTLTARLMGRPAAVQMRPDSPFIKELNRDLTLLGKLQFTSIWSPLDMMIVPASSSLLPVGTMRRIMSPAHVLMPYDPQVMRAVIEALA